MPKWLPPVLALFLLFFVLSNPEEAGPQTRSFFSWLGTQGANAATFVDGLIGEPSGSDSDSNSSEGTTLVPDDGGQPGPADEPTTGVEGVTPQNTFDGSSG